MRVFVREIEVENFTLFDELRLELGEGLNVFLGANATGKTHLLKLLYGAIWCSGKERKHLTDAKRVLGEKIVALFRPNPPRLGRLVRGGKARVKLEFMGRHGSSSLVFSFTVKAQREVGRLELPGERMGEPVYIPPKDLVAAWYFPEVYEDYEDGAGFEEMYYDLAKQARRGPKKGRPREPQRRLRELLNSVLPDKARMSKGVLFLGQHELSLVAEGFRRLTVLDHLIANGVLLEAPFIFWDEPDASLNAKLVRGLAELIVELAEGAQVFVATHSYLLVKWLDHLAEDARFFRFYLDDGGSVRVAVGRRYLDVVPEDLDEILKAYRELMEYEAELLDEE